MMPAIKKLNDMVMCCKFSKRDRGREIGFCKNLRLYKFQKNNTTLCVSLNLLISRDIRSLLSSSISIAFISSYKQKKGGQKTGDKILKPICTGTGEPKEKLKVRCFVPVL